ncbi:MAG: SH3 domain-containing protein [Patescibacteria group bacterium]
MPHFQYLAGYSIVDFRANKVDWKRFGLDSIEPIPVLINPQTTPVALKVTAQDGLNVRGGPGTDQPRLGKLAFAEMVIPLEKTSGWVKIKYGDGFGWVSESYLV